MAYFRRRFRTRYRTRYVRRGRRGGGGMNKWLTFGGGAIAGYMAPQVIPYQNELALVLAAAPVKLPRAVRSIASGYVIGRITRNITTGGVGSGTGGNSPWL